MHPKTPRPPPPTACLIASVRPPWTATQNGAIGGPGESTTQICGEAFGSPQLESGNGENVATQVGGTPQSEMCCRSASITPLQFQSQGEPSILLDKPVPPMVESLLCPD